MTLELGASAFARGLDDVAAGADRLRADRDRIGRQVEGLLDGGWRGAAATAFATAYGEWRRALDEVVDGLVVSAELMRAAEAALRQGDAASATALRSLSARLEDPLG